MKDIDAIRKAIENGSIDSVRYLLVTSDEHGLTSADLVHNALIPAVQKIGADFADNLITISSLTDRVMACRTAVDLILDTKDSSELAALSQVFCNIGSGDSSRSEIRLDIADEGYSVESLTMHCSISDAMNALYRFATLLLTSAHSLAAIPYRQDIEYTFRIGNGTTCILRGAPLPPNAVHRCGVTEVLPTSEPGPAFDVVETSAPTLTVPPVRRTRRLQFVPSYRQTA